MKLLPIILAIFMVPVLCAASILDGDWEVTKYDTAAVHALTIEKAKTVYGTQILISKKHIRFGPDSIRNPRIVQTNEGEDRLIVDLGELAAAISLRTFEVRDRKGNQWMAPLGMIEMLGDDSIIFQWDGVIFVAKRTPTQPSALVNGEKPRD